MHNLTKQMSVGDKTVGTLPTFLPHCCPAFLPLLHKLPYPLSRLFTQDGTSTTKSKKRKSRTSSSTKPNPLCPLVDPHITPREDYRFMMVGDKFSKLEYFQAHAHEDAGTPAHAKCPSYLCIIVCSYMCMRIVCMCVTCLPTFSKMESFIPHFQSLYVFTCVYTDRTGGRELKSIRKPTTCRMVCNKPGCEQEYRARSYQKDHGFWVVVGIPRCGCDPLLPAERRQRSVYTKYMTPAVRNAVVGTVPTKNGTSQMKQIINNVQLQTGKLLTYQQARSVWCNNPSVSECVCGRREGDYGVGVQGHLHLCILALTGG